jgi:hypothetical protein
MIIKMILGGIIGGALGFLINLLSKRFLSGGGFI